MKSRAAIGNHPLHPAIVTLPIGAFFLALVGDIAHAGTRSDFWYQFAFVCIGIGIVTALLAAILGFIDYFTVKMSAAAGRIATTHMILNLSAVVLYAISYILRRENGALNTGRWPLAFLLEVVPFAGLGLSGWLGGRLTFEHRVGVVENADPEADEIGRRESRAS
jgi:uncharacterized membrane protein